MVLKAHKSILNVSITSSAQIPVVTSIIEKTEDITKTAMSSAAISESVVTTALFLSQTQTKLTGILDKFTVKGIE
jgi:hypothetical protein